MDFQVWLGFMAASLILTVTPGPSIFLGIAHALRFGHRRVFFTALGDITANGIQMLLVALGLGVVIANSEFAFAVIKVFGVITLCFMGLKMLLARPTAIEEPESVGDVVSNYKLFWSGFMVAAGNPKAIVFFTAFFPQFIDIHTPVLPQLLIMCPSMAVLDFTLVMLYAWLARHLASTTRLSLLSVTRGSGVLLLGAAAKKSVIES